MTPPILRRMILEVGSAMQDRAVVDELEVARLEHHLQHDVGMVGDGHKGTERGFLFRADGRVAVLHGAAHITMLEVAVEPAVFRSRSSGRCRSGPAGPCARRRPPDGAGRSPCRIPQADRGTSPAACYGRYGRWRSGFRRPDIAIFRLSMATMPTSPLGLVCAVWKPPD